MGPALKLKAFQPQNRSANDHPALCGVEHLSTVPLLRLKWHEIRAIHWPLIRRAFPDEDKCGFSGRDPLNRRANTGHVGSRWRAFTEIGQGADLNGQQYGAMWDLLSYLFWMVVLIGVVFAIGFGIKAYLSGALPFGSFMSGGRERRLDVIDHANVDGKRRLLLVRRDNVEHLIMTGGPVDVVIETGIGAIAPSPATLARATTATAEPAQPKPGVSEPVFSRPARTFSKAVGEN